jgi:subtilisin family serine protease
MIKRLRAERQTQYWQLKWSNKPPSTQLSYNESTVAAKLRFDELVRVALPLTRWWCKYVWNERNQIKLSDFSDPAERETLAKQMEAGADDESVSDLLWMIEIIGRIQWEYEPEEHRHPEDKPDCRGMVDAFHRLTEGMDLKQLPEASVLWSVNRNRPVAQAVWKSVVATKADAAIRLFGLSCEGLQWAIVDSGIDATHPAFRKRVSREQPISKASRPFNKDDGSAENQTRVAMTYDFTRLRQIMSLEVHADGSVTTPALRPTNGDEKGNEGTEPGAGHSMPATSPAHPVPPRPGTADAGGEPVLASFSPDDLDRIRQMQDGLRSGRTLDWRTLQLLLRIPHEADVYARPIHEHGAHVAGILAGDWRLSDDPSVTGDHDLRGVCPDLTLLDLRVLDAEGRGDEFAVLAALQFIRWLNANKDTPVVHGVNISMSLLHDVANFACGRTPVCDECERLVGSGFVVVAGTGTKANPSRHGCGP